MASRKSRRLLAILVILTILVGTIGIFLAFYLDPDAAEVFELSGRIRVQNAMRYSGSIGLELADARGRVLKCCVGTDDLRGLYIGTMHPRFRGGRRVPGYCLSRDLLSGILRDWLRARTAEVDIARAGHPPKNHAPTEEELKAVLVSRFLDAMSER